ncbi:N-acetylmuramoyl-L-alanine amidase [Nocardioides pacificus]
MSLLPAHVRVRAAVPASVVGLLAALLAAPAPALPAEVSPSAVAPERVRLVDPSGAGVRRAEVPLPRALLRSARAGSAVRRTAALPTSGFRMVALTWQDQAAGRGLAFRTRTQAGWGPWTTAEPLTDVADGAEGRAARVSGSQLAWVPRSDAVQVRIRGGQPRGLSLVLLDPAARPSDARPAAPAATSAGTASRASTVSRTGTVQARAGERRFAPRPWLLGRKQWGARESWRTSPPRYNRRIQQVHVHHTATGNSYSRADVPAMIRGMYSYHTRDLGWSDLGYNFLVDKFGRAWVGRAGGPNKPVRGAHTLGFNHTSVGVALIGNHEGVAPWKRAVTKLVRLSAWKLDRAGKRPAGTSRVRSQGSDRFPAGQRVWLKAIDGHRDTNQTACPGGDLHDLLPGIRRRAQRLADRHGR